MENHPTRVRYDNPKMYRWTSWDANTPFAPSFDVPVYIDYCGNSITKDLIKLLDASYTSYEIQEKVKVLKELLYKID